MLPLFAVPLQAQDRSQRGIRGGSVWSFCALLVSTFCGLKVFVSEGSGNVASLRGLGECVTAPPGFRTCGSSACMVFD